MTFAVLSVFFLYYIVASTNKADCRDKTLSLIVLIITPIIINQLLFRWLLRDPEMKVRSNYGPYQEAVDRFFSQLIIQVADLQVYEFVFYFQITIVFILSTSHH